MKWRDWKDPQKRRASIISGLIKQHKFVTASVRIYAQINDGELNCLGEGIAGGFTKTDVTRGAAQMLREAADELEKICDAEDEKGDW